MAPPWLVQENQCGTPSQSGPQSSTGPVRLQVAADPEEPLVLAAGLGGRDRVVDLHDHEIAASVAVQVGDGNPAALVEPGEPAGHVDPRRPARDGAVGGQPVTDPVEAPVLLRPVVDHEDDQVAPALGVGAGDRDTGARVLPGEPVGDVDPRGPASGEGPVGAQATADPVQPAVLLRPVVDHQDDDVHPAVAAEVGDGDVGALVGPGEPVGYVDPRRPAGRHAVRGQAVSEPVEAAVLLRAVVDHQDDEVLPAGQIGHRRRRRPGSPRRTSRGSGESPGALYFSSQQNFGGHCRNESGNRVRGSAVRSRSGRRSGEVCQQPIGRGTIRHRARSTHLCVLLVTLRHRSAHVRNRSRPRRRADRAPARRSPVRRAARARRTAPPGRGGRPPGGSRGVGRRRPAARPAAR